MKRRSQVGGAFQAAAEQEDVETALPAGLNPNNTTHQVISIMSTVLSYQGFFKR